MLVADYRWTRCPIPEYFCVLLMYFWGVTPEDSPNLGPVAPVSKCVTVVNVLNVPEALSRETGVRNYVHELSTS